MRTIIITLCALLLMAIPVKAEEMVLYDDFNSFLIEPTKWHGRQFQQTYDLVREIVREIKGRKLRMAIVGHSDIEAGDTGNKYATNCLRPPYEVAEKITAVKARMRVNHFWVMDCVDNPDSNWSQARARMGGVFFHDGNVADSEDPWDFTGDVMADILIRKQIDGSGPSRSLLEVVPRVFECLDYNCDYVEYLESTNEPVRTIRRGQPITLGIEWDESNQGFLFRYGRQEDFVSYARTYNPVFPAPSTLLKFLRVQVIMPNCTSPPRPMYLMDASFDDLFVNESALANADGLD
jgi:hypothetical protein